MPRRLKLGTIVNSGQMYLVYRNQAAAASLFNCTPVGRASDSVMAPT